MSAEGYIWLTIGAYLFLIGCRRLPMPNGGIGDLFDLVSRERIQKSLRFWGVSIIVVGVMIYLRLW